MTVDISLVIPAYNERERIPKTLADYCRFSEKLNCNVEIIVVFDGFDGTSKIVEEYARKHDGIIKCLKFKSRLGKGGALMRGFSSAKGKLIGFADADGSTTLDEFIKLVEIMKNDSECDGVIGSRWVKGAEFIKKPPPSRIFASRGLNALVRGFLRLHFKDTQCGAKLFKREIIEKCLPYINISSFSFDIYLLYVAVKMGFKIKEVPLKWEYVDGSKIEICDVLKIFLDVCMLKKNYLEASTFAY